MARPVLRANTRNGQFRQAIPADVRAILDKLPAPYRPRGWGKTEITLTLGTADGRKMAAEHARIAAEVQSRIAKLRAGPIRLSQKDVVALSKRAYEGFATAAGDDPGPASVWRGAQQMMANVKAGRSLAIETPGERRQRALEGHFGRWADTFLAGEGIVTDPASRWRLVEALADALNDAAAKLERNAKGDYAPDPKAGRFPEWVDPRGVAKGGSDDRNKLTLAKLVDRWRKHPEQAEQAASTIRRYEGVFNALATFLDNPDARSVTHDDVHRYIEARMAADAKPKPLKPRVARDVHKAAISSVFAWSVAKKITVNNPAQDVAIKVAKPEKLRSKDATDDEARTVADACIALPPDIAKPRSFEAAAKWCVLLALYTGSRIGELTQLRREDVTETKAGMTLRLTPEAGAIKGREYRDVPIHPRIVELGFADFIKSASGGALFYRPGDRRKSDAKTSQAEILARDVAEWSRTNGLGDPLLLRPLHALRHRFRTEGRRAGVDDDCAKAIGGWSRGADMASGYGEFPVDVLRREVEKLRAERIEGRGD